MNTMDKMVWSSCEAWQMCHIGQFFGESFKRVLFWKRWNLVQDQQVQDQHLASLCRARFSIKNYVKQGHFGHLLQHQYCGGGKGV